MTALDRTLLSNPEAADTARCAIAHDEAFAGEAIASERQAFRLESLERTCEPVPALAEPVSPAPPPIGTQVALEGGVRSSRRARKEHEGSAPAQVDGEGQVGWVGPCSPERPVMEILFRCIESGRRYYGVRLNGQEIFVGTRSECDRFLSIHNEKVATEQAEARRTPRGRPAALQIYRTARA